MEADRLGVGDALLGEDSLREVDRSALPGVSGLFAARQLASQPVEFLALLAGHVLLRYEVAIRSYGALSTTFGKRVGWLEAPPVCEPPVAALLSIPSPPGSSSERRAEGPEEVCGPLLRELGYSM